MSKSEVLNIDNVSLASLLSGYGICRNECEG